MAVIDSAIGLWRAGNYSGSGDWLDESGNGNDWTIDGATFVAQSDPDLAYFSFDGTDDDLSTADASDLLTPGAGDFTVVYAIQTPANVSGDGFPFLDKKGGFTTQTGWHIRETGSGLALVDVGDGSSNFQDSDGPLSNSTDHVLALRLDRSAEELEVFIDGTGSGSPTDTTGLGSTAGPSVTVNSVGGVFSPGRVYGIAIFDSALSDADIATAGEELTNFGPSSAQKVLPSAQIRRRHGIR